MIEMALLEEAKETDNKVRWDAELEDARFSLYIPKWRVPEPWPRLIQVAVSPRTQSKQPSLSRAAASKAPDSRKQPIVSHLNKVREHTQTIRYQPDGDAAAWEIGEPYIPASMTYGAVLDTPQLAAPLAERDTVYADSLS